MSKELDLFIGVRVTGRLQESLDAASLPFRRYFEGGKFLTVIDREDGRWLGKAITRTATDDRLDDMKRHVWSVIRKIDPEVGITFDRVSVTHVPPPPEVEEPELEAPPEAAAAADAKPDAKADAKPDAKPDATPEAKPDATPDATPEAKPDAKPDAKPESAATPPK